MIKTVEVKIFKERRNGELKESVIALNVPGRYKPASIIKTYIERVNKNSLSKIYWYEIVRVVNDPGRFYD